MGSLNPPRSAQPLCWERSRGRCSTSGNQCWVHHHHTGMDRPSLAGWLNSSFSHGEARADKPDPRQCERSQVSRTSHKRLNILVYTAFPDFLVAKLISGWNKGHRRTCPCCCGAPPAIAREEDDVNAPESPLPGKVATLRSHADVGAPGEAPRHDLSPDKATVPGFDLLYPRSCS
ncbi:uncharacterized protein LJ206_020626 isoform 1-T2 [Theristicus caerulescens]